VLSVHLCNTFEHQELNCCGHGNTSAAECWVIITVCVSENNTTRKWKKK
jgi:hypothetical protein